MIIEQIFPKAWEIREETLKIQAENEKKLNKELEIYYESLLQSLRTGILFEKTRGNFKLFHAINGEEERKKCIRVFRRLEFFLKTQGYLFYKIFSTESGSFEGIQVSWK